MEGFGPATYGDAFAEVYDDWYAELGDVDACVDRLSALAGGGPVLELGVGTGRVAAPLSERGVAVVGLDASRAMLARLVARTGGVVPVAGDASSLPFGPGAFALVFAAYNTFLSIGGAEAQAACLASSARCLSPGGRVVVEAMVAPEGERPSSSVEVTRLTPESVVLLVAREDPDEQTIEGQHVHITEAGIRLRPWSVHYLDHDQLDAMAGSAGLELEHRWSDWDGTPLRPADAVAVSVYRRSR